MLRRFREHDCRVVRELNGVWDFALLGDVDPDGVDIGSIRFDDRMAVPGCFDATPAYAGRRGLAAYRTRIWLADATPHRLVFDGLHHWGRVFVGGRVIGEHVGGFTRFALEIPEPAAGEAEVVVLVDNRINPERCPLHLDYFDWYHFGGISRGVELHRLGNAWIDAVRVVTEDYRTGRLAIAIDWGARPSAGPARPAELTVRCAGRTIAQRVDLDEASGRVQMTMELPGAALWSPQEPNLHELYVRIATDDGADDLRERVGIRQVQCRGREILINGAPIRLLGFNRHEAHPQFGHTVPEQLMVSDLQQMRDMGCNFVRGSHYPQDVRFLDLCDEMGVCVWEESIGWQHKLPHLTDEQFLRAQETNISEMIASAANRPSVILWGILNESQSGEPACRPSYERLLGHIRRLDPTRPVTYATCVALRDLCYDLADVISVNTYPGWYTGSIEGIPEALDKIVDHLDGVAGQAEKPFILSEIGAAAVYGCRDWNADRWTEQYQARLLETVMRHLFIDRSRACGLAIWQFCDGRTMPTLPHPVMTRARGFNNKGVVDEYRRPKMAYETIKRWFAELRAGGKGAAAGKR